MLDVKNALTQWGDSAKLGNALFCELGKKPPIPAYPTCELGKKPPIPAYLVASASFAPSVVNRRFRFNQEL